MVNNIIYVEMKREVEYLQEFADRMLANLLFIKKQTQIQDSKLYWIGIKMSNNGEKFNDRDKGMVSQLRNQIELLVAFQEEVLKIIENIQNKLRIVTEILKEEENSKVQQSKVFYIIRVINAEIVELYGLLEEYIKEQHIFMNSIKSAEEFIKQKGITKKYIFRKKIINLLKRR